MKESWLDLLSIVANLIQVGSFVFVVVAFWRARNAIKRYLADRASSVSERPCALVIGLGADITGAVKSFLQDHNWDFPVEPYIRQGYFTPDEFIPIVKDIHKIKERLDRAGVSEVHLFYRGPVTMAAAIGAITDNWVPVKVYDFKEGTYQYHATLEKGLVKGLTVGSIVSEGESLILAE